MSQGPLIPRRHLFGNPNKPSVRLSPDGSRIAYLAPLDGVLNVWVADREDPDAARAVTHDTVRGVRFHLWAHTSTHILFLQDRNGDENWRLFVVTWAPAETKDLTPFDGAQARVWRASPRFPTSVIVGLNMRSASWHDAYRVDIITGETRA